MMTDLSLDDLRNLPEALDDVMFGVTSHLVDTSELSADALDNLAVVVDAARAFSRLVSVCTTCERTGKVASAYNADQTVFVDCPDCVDGLVVSPEAIERMRQVIHNTAGTGTGEDGYQKVWVSQHAQEMAALGLRAALGIEKT